MVTPSIAPALSPIIQVSDVREKGVVLHNVKTSKVGLRCLLVSFNVSNFNVSRYEVRIMQEINKFCHNCVSESLREAVIYLEVAQEVLPVGRCRLVNDAAGEILCSLWQSKPRAPIELAPFICRHGRGAVSLWH